MANPIRVLIVDDSAFSRVSIGKMLDQIPHVQVVGYAIDGESGLRKVLELKPDLITLDLEMPKMGGFSLLRLIMQSCPTPVIVISSRSSEGDVFRALELGAIDFVAKPSRSASSEFYSIQDDLTRKICDFSDCGPARFRLGMYRPGEGTTTALRRTFPSAKNVRCPRVVAIGASTGGPPALHQFFASFSRVPQLSIVVAQHMPSGFTRSFADRLNDHSVFRVTEAVNGDRMQPGNVYICPGERNMLLRHLNGTVVIQVVKPPKGQLYTPSVDTLFNSAAVAYGPELLGIILTGMGNDGSQGVRAIKEAGGQVIAESEESCVVYGMPKEAVETGCVNQIVPISGLAQEVLRRCL